MTKYSTVPMEWDAWGNVTKVDTHAYSWDDTNRMTKFDKSGGTTGDATYSYLPGSWKRYKRTEVTAQGTTTEYSVYDGPNVVGSYGSNGTLNARYVTPGLDANLSETRSGSAYYYLADALGSVRSVLDASEAVQNMYDYYAFGESLAAAGATRPYRYTAREYEPSAVLDMHYYRNRYYLSGLGIFMSRDAMRGDDARGWGYAGNIPTAFVDPYGFFIWGGIKDILKWAWQTAEWAGHGFLDLWDSANDIVDPIRKPIEAGEKLYNLYNDARDWKEWQEYCNDWHDKCFGDEGGDGGIVNGRNIASQELEDWCNTLFGNRCTGQKGLCAEKNPGFDLIRDVINSTPGTTVTGPPSGFDLTREP